MDLNPKDLGDHFMIPRDDFYDLARSAFSDSTLRERILNSAQSTAFFAVTTVCALTGVRVYYKTKDWYEERKFLRETGTGPEAVADPIPFKK